MPEQFPEVLRIQVMGSRGMGFRRRGFRMGDSVGSLGQVPMKCLLMIRASITPRCELRREGSLFLREVWVLELYGFTDFGKVRL